MGVDWEEMRNTGGAFASTFRAKVRGGWLVAAGSQTTPAMAFIPDPRHLWDGTPAGNVIVSTEERELMRMAAEVFMSGEAPAFIKERERGGESSVGG